MQAAIRQFGLLSAAKEALQHRVVHGLQTRVLICGADLLGAPASQRYELSLMREKSLAEGLAELTAQEL